jgi:hypothetical protein
MLSDIGKMMEIYGIGSLHPTNRPYTTEKVASGTPSVHCQPRPHNISPTAHFTMIRPLLPPYPKPYIEQRFTTIQKIPARVTLSGIGLQHLPPKPVHPLPITVKDTIRAYPYHRLDGRWFLHKIHGSPNSKCLIKALKKSSLRIVSDGSFKNGFSTAACVNTDKEQSF